MRKTLAFLTGLLCLVSVATAEAQGLPLVRPEQVGLSSDRLARLTAALRADVEKGAIPGAVLLVSRHGKIALFEGIGAIDPQTKAPMTRDAIFRIYSMSKPITSVTAMTLVEDGRLGLGDPVSKYVPQFGAVKVGVEKADPGGGAPTLELVPVRRPMTVQDLF